MREPRNYENPLCAQSGGDAWFPESGQGTALETVHARTVCNNCEHKFECAEWGLRYEDFGIWGGLTELDRKRIRRQKNITVDRDRSA